MMIFIKPLLHPRGKLRFRKLLNTNSVLICHLKGLEECNPPYGKRWQLYILPQYLASLTKPIGTQKAIFFA